MPMNRHDEVCAICEICGRPFPPIFALMQLQNYAAGQWARD